MSKHLIVWLLLISFLASVPMVAAQDTDDEDDIEESSEAGSEASDDHGEDDAAESSDESDDESDDEEVSSRGPGAVILMVGLGALALVGFAYGARQTRQES